MPNASHLSIEIKYGFMAHKAGYAENLKHSVPPVRKHPGINFHNNEQG